MSQLEDIPIWMFYQLLNKLLTKLSKAVNSGKISIINYKLRTCEFEGHNVKMSINFKLSEEEKKRTIYFYVVRTKNNGFVKIKLSFAKSVLLRN